MGWRERGLRVTKYHHAQRPQVVVRQCLGAFLLLLSTCSQCRRRRSLCSQGLQVSRDAVEANEDMIAYGWSRGRGLSHGGVVLIRLGGGALALLASGRVHVGSAVVA